MRMIQYELQLQRYVIAGGDIAGECCDHWCDVALPQLKMEVLKSDYDDIAELVDQSVFAGEESPGWQDFRNCYVNILHGDNLAWRLIRVWVSADGLLLEYHNKEFGETACLSLIDPGALKIRFFVPRNNQKSDGVYNVHIVGEGEHMRTFVTEHIGGIRREFEFCASWEKVIITEFADF